MSINDHVMEVQEFALMAALRAGAIAPCFAHEEVLLIKGDLDAKSRAYAVATNGWKAGNITCDREELMAAVADTIEQATDDCGRCDDIRRA